MYLGKRRWDGERLDQSFIQGKKERKELASWVETESGFEREGLGWGDWGRKEKKRTRLEPPKELQIKWRRELRIGELVCHNIMNCIHACVRVSLLIWVSRQAREQWKQPTQLRTKREKLPSGMTDGKVLLGQSKTGLDPSLLFFLLRMFMLVK